jgi:hypothetical protein
VTDRQDLQLQGGAAAERQYEGRDEGGEHATERESMPGR